MEETQARVKMGSASRITNEQQAGKALGFITAKLNERDTVAEEANRRIAEIVREAKAEIRIIESDISKTTDRLEIYALNNKGLFGKNKSVKLPEGQFGWKRDADRFEYPNDDEALVARIQKLAEDFNVPVEQLKELYSIITTPVTDYSPNKKKLQEFIAEHPKGKKILAYLGIKFVEGEEKFFAQKDTGKAIKDFAKIAKKVGD